MKNDSKYYNDKFHVIIYLKIISNIPLKLISQKYKKRFQILLWFFKILS